MTPRTPSQRTTLRRGRRIGIAGAALGLVVGGLTLVPAVHATATMVNDFESYADNDASTAAGWFEYMGGGGGAGRGIQTVAPTDSVAFSGQSGDNKVLSIGWNVTASGAYAGVGFNFPVASPADWSNHDGIRFWFRGSEGGGSLNLEVQTANGAGGGTAMAYTATTISDNTGGWQLVEIPFNTLTNGHSWNAGGATLDLTVVKTFIFAAASGQDTPGEGAKIDMIELYNTGDAATPMAPTTTTTSTTTTTVASGSSTETTAAPTTAAPTTAAPTTVDPAGPRTESVQDFESFPSSESVPSTWFNYGNAGGGISIVGPTDARARSGQTGDNKILAWGFDAESDPGYGGVGQEFTTPVNWSGFTGIQFWFFGSGEGGELQIEIGEDKTSDVERYRAPAFKDDQTGWRLIKLPFSSFKAGEYNPAPGNGVLNLVSVSNLVFAANSGSTDAGVALDDISVYFDGSLPSVGSSTSASTSTMAVVLVLAGISLAVIGRTRRQAVD